MKTILIIDDDRDICEILEDYLKKQGYEVYIAFNLNDARIMMKTINFDIVLCDVVLPDGNGIDFLREFSRKCMNLNIIMTSGNPDPHDTIKGLENFDFDFLAKPYNLANLNSAIKKSLSPKNSP